MCALATLCLLSACVKVAPPAGAPKVLNIGHGGSGFLSLMFPFNPYAASSMSGIINALENGAAGVEVDLQITADSVLILFHDMELDNLTALSGCVAMAQSADVVGTPYRCGFPYDLFQKDSVVTFQQWLQYAVALNPIPHLHIDIHAYTTCATDPYHNADALVEKMVEQLAQVNYPTGKIIVTCSNPDLLLHTARLNPLLILSHEETESFDRGLDIVTQHNFPYLTIKASLLTSEHVVQANAQGIKVITFGRKSRNGIARVVNMGPHVYQSDNVKMLTRLTR